MSEWIGGYKRITPMQTVGSGSARWCIAVQGLERFFVKEFLSPVYPPQENNELGRKQRERCDTFERRKMRLYEAVSCVIGDTLVPVIDFFRYERKYYAVSEAMPDSHITAEDLSGFSSEAKRRLLFDAALCLQRLHTQGVVHADLKPDHFLLLKRPEGLHLRLIDVDSGFLADDPPTEKREMEGDPAFLAPEAFLRMIGQDAKLGPRLDSFAFGAIIHLVWTGEMPAFDHTQYHYLYEAALNGGAIRFSDELPAEWHAVLHRMLSADPSKRPDDATVTALFEAELPEKQRDGEYYRNGLSRLIKQGYC